MGSLRAKAEARRLEGHYLPGRRRPGGFKINMVRDRSGGRSAAERAGLEISMGARVVKMACRHARQAHQAGGAQFQGERHAAGRHETGWNISAKQKQGQQPYAGP